LESQFFTESLFLDFAKTTPVRAALARPHCIQRLGMAKLPTHIVPEFREYADYARLSAAKEWAQAEGERTQWLYRQKLLQFG